MINLISPNLLSKNTPDESSDVQLSGGPARIKKQSSPTPSEEYPMITLDPSIFKTRKASRKTED